MTNKSETYLRAKLAECGVPAHMHDGYINYLLHHIGGGSFMTAVLSNDLKEACNRGDEANLAALANHVKFLYNHAPYNCWGSPEKVETWLSKREVMTHGPVD